MNNHITVARSLLIIAFIVAISSCKKNDAASPKRTYHLTNYHSVYKSNFANLPPRDITIDSVQNNDELLVLDPRSSSIIFRGDTFSRSSLYGDNIYMKQWPAAGGPAYTVDLNHDSILVHYAEGSTTATSSHSYVRDERGYWKK